MFSGRQRPLWSGQWVFWQNLEGRSGKTRALNLSLKPRGLGMPALPPQCLIKWTNGGGLKICAAVWRGQDGKCQVEKMGGARP